MAGYIEDRWLKKRPDKKTGKRERTKLYGKCKRYKVAGIPGVRNRSFDTVEEAKVWKAKAIIDTKRNEFIDERDGDILLADYIVNEWWNTRDDPTGTAITMKSKIWNHIVDSSLGPLPMRVIDDGHLIRWRKELKSRGLEPATIEVIWNHLSTIFKSVVGKRILKNPCTEAASDVRPPKPGKTKARAWTVEEVHAIRAELPPRYRIVPSLGVKASERQAEAFGFSPDDIDEERMVLHVRRQLLWANSVKPYFKLPKGQKERTVPLSPGLLREVREHEGQFPPVTVTLPWEGPGNDGRPTATVRLLVTTQLGNRVHPSTYNNKTMKPALARAGLIAPRKEGATWGWEPSREKMHHRYRHTYASVQLLAGEDPVSVSHWMGHASVDTTFRIYAHFIPDKGDRGRTAVDAWMERDVPTAVSPDLFGIDSLGYTVRRPLSQVLVDLACEGGAMLYLNGARSGGAWLLGLQQTAGAELLGEVLTAPNPDPDRALATGLAWVQAYAEQAGLEVKSAENLNGQYPEEARPFQALGRLAIAPSAAESPIPTESP